MHNHALFNVQFFVTAKPNPIDVRKAVTSRNLTEIKKIIYKTNQDTEISAKKHASYFFNKSICNFAHIKS